jgi:hypothetical protein
VTSFDPPATGGDGVEHDADLANLTDGDPSTAWMTETYNTPNFGGLKPGVGFVLRLDAAAHLDDVTLTSPSRGWSVEVRLADGPKSTLADWGDAVASKATITDDTTTLALHGHQAGAVLVWITNLGPSNQVVIGDVKVSGTAVAS